MIKNLKNRQEGFTIIEVMIVLVIAAVILLIVFLAVPALQRNSRNTQRKNDAAGLLAGAGEFLNNNSGKVPTAWANNQITGATGTIAAGAKLGYYTAATVQATQVTTAPNADTLILVTGAKCGATTGTTAAQTRGFAVVYGIENGGGTYSSTCTDS